MKVANEVVNLLSTARNQNAVPLPIRTRTMRKLLSRTTKSNEKNSNDKLRNGGVNLQSLVKSPITVYFPENLNKVLSRTTKEKL